MPRPAVELARHGGLDLRVHSLEEVLLAQVLPQLRQVLAQMLLAQAVGVEDADRLADGIGGALHQRGNESRIKKVCVARGEQVPAAHRRRQPQVRLQLHGKALRPGHRRVLPQEAGEAREGHEAVGDEGRVDAGSHANVRQQAPVLCGCDPGVHDVANRHEVCRVRTPVQRVQVRLLLNGSQVVLLHEQAHQREVHEEHVQFVPKRQARGLRAVQKFLGGIEGPEHDGLILRELAQALLHVRVPDPRGLVRCRAREGLHLVQHHAHVAAAGLRQRLHGVLLDLQAFPPGDLRATPRNEVLGRA
mmetsp:Transcript_19562/g.54695  ORF Transcript_19562/g.54695 Transcript_19562/m.54695 type:complete len:303 (+) Transcript_19562:430-1338(+)